MVVALDLLRARRKALLDSIHLSGTNSFAFSPHIAVERLIARMGMTTVVPLATGMLSSVSPDSEMIGALKGMTSSTPACTKLRSRIIKLNIHILTTRLRAGTGGWVRRTSRVTLSRYGSELVSSS